MWRPNGWLRRAWLRFGAMRRLFVLYFNWERLFWVFFDWYCALGSCGNLCQCDHHFESLLWPVLKHGPRSLTLARVIGLTKPRRHSEGECRLDQCVFARAAQNRPMRELLCSVSRKSVRVGTRKMVNYAWISWSQGKLWWRTVAILTCKSIVKFEYRGERLIEPSSSWFPPKFPSG